MARQIIEVQTDTWMLCEGIETSVFIGETDEPIEIAESYESLIDQHLNSYIFGRKIAALHYDETAAFIAKMKEVAEYAERRAKELGWEEL